MKLINTGDPQLKPSVMMLVYGEGGVGKTTFTATAPKPLLADCENGSKYFGLRGIKLDVALIESWSDIKEFIELIKDSDYETIILDPIGELMEKLQRFMVAKGDTKLVTKDGSPTLAGWGWLKKTMRDFLKVIRDMNKHVIIVAHLDERDDEGRIVKRPKVATKLSDEIVNMVDIVAYMTVFNDGSEEKRVLIVDPSNDKYTAKDRTGALGKYIEPDFTKIVNAVQGNETYSWTKNPQEPKTNSEKQPKVAKKAPQPISREESRETCLACGSNRTTVALTAPDNIRNPSRPYWKCLECPPAKSFSHWASDKDREALEGQKAS